MDFAATALLDGWGMHNAIKQGLQTTGIGLVPLMLVQDAGGRFMTVKGAGNYKHTSFVIASAARQFTALTRLHGSPRPAASR